MTSLGGVDLTDVHAPAGPAHGRSFCGCASSALAAATTSAAKPCAGSSQDLAGRERREFKTSADGAAAAKTAAAVREEIAHTLGVEGHVLRGRRAAAHGSQLFSKSEFADARRRHLSKQESMSKAGAGMGGQTCRSRHGSAALPLRAQGERRGAVFAALEALQPKQETVFWQDEVLEAILEQEHRRLLEALETTKEKHLHETLQLHMLGDGQATLFVLGDEMFTPSGGTKELLGGLFRFERQETRSRIGSWLEMIGAQQGDTLLHLSMRVGGSSEEEKARVAVELLGHGCSFEVTNARGELPAAIDKAAFRRALFTMLPGWRRDAAQRREHQANIEATREAKVRHEARMARRLARHKAQEAEEAEASRLEEQARRDMQERVDRHERLEKISTQLTKNQMREAQVDLGTRELLAELRSVLPGFMRGLACLAPGRVDGRLFSR